jgi:hypothetical protein
MSRTGSRHLHGTNYTDVDTCSIDPPWREFKFRYEKGHGKYGGKLMRSLMGFGLVLLLTILALSLGLASTEQVGEMVNATGSLDQITAAGNITQESRVLLNATNATDTLNSTKLKNATILENLTRPENVSSKNKVIINASSAPFNVEPSGKAVFVIDDGLTPIKSAGKIGQSSINGASLMRAVDGTPHGYTTYYN